MCYELVLEMLKKYLAQRCEKHNAIIGAVHAHEYWWKSNMRADDGFEE